jgi:hypothetical protein
MVVNFNFPPFFSLSHREWRPLSPKATTIRSDAPFRTRWCLSKSPVAFTCYTHTHTLTHTHTHTHTHNMYGNGRSQSALQVERRKN